MTIPLYRWSDSTPQFRRRLGAARSDDLSAYRNFPTDAPRVASPSFYALLGRFLDGDRKSTRLNSSHSQISYAVFCLKKNKNCRIWFTLSHRILNEIYYPTVHQQVTRDFQ